MKATPGWLKWKSKFVSNEASGKTQLLEMNFAPWATAWSTPANMSAAKGLSFSTTRMRQFGHAALTASTSMDSSNAQPGSVVDGGVVPPRWLITRRQPLVLVHTGRWNWRR
jgi:hypothetical protein